MKKRLFSVMLTLALACSGFLTACGPKMSDTEQTLEIYCLEAGYGYQWCLDMAERFKEQDWVKEKYPNLIIPPVQHNDIGNFADTKLSGDQKSNSIDLLFGGLLNSYAEAEGSAILELTDVVYNQKVPGEDILYRDKSLQSFNESNKFLDVSSSSIDPRYFVTSWVGGMDGFIYNETLLDQMGAKIPNTTDEFLELCAEIKANEGKDNGKYNKGVVFLQSKDTDYWKYCFPIWWAQYEQKDGYVDFWNGIDEGRVSKNIFTQQGRLKSLEMYEKLLDYNKGYLDPNSMKWDFMTAQTAFLKGQGLFHVNGDWFDNEMKKAKEEIKKTEGIDYSFKMMKTPIISAIREKTPSIPDDATLSAVVSAIDAGETSYGNVTADDFQTIVEARSIVYTIGSQHAAVIPSYATGKNVAVDFLRFMATDIGNASYMKSTAGASLPFHYT